MDTKVSQSTEEAPSAIASSKKDPFATSNSPTRENIPTVFDSEIEKESDSEDEFINRFQQMSQNENKIKAKEIAEILSKEQPNLRAVKQIEELQQNWVSQHE